MLKDIKKDMLNYALDRSYNYIPEELEEVINNYNDGDVYSYDDEKVDELWNYFESLIENNYSPEEKLNREVGYYNGYKLAMEILTNNNK